MVGAWVDHVNGGVVKERDEERESELGVEVLAGNVGWRGKGEGRVEDLWGKST